MRARRGQQSGIVLVVVLFFVLLLASSIASFIRRVAVDANVARNRDAALQAEALARGGVRLAEALLIEDLRQKRAEATEEGNLPDSLRDVWARVGEVDLIDDPDISLHLRIEDASARVNLNGFLDQEGKLPDEARNFLKEFLEGVIEAMPGRPEDKLYEPEELIDALVDWIDADETGVRGGVEDGVYQEQDPPYRAPNRPLLSVDELRLVDGFDGPLVEALRPYVGVHPFFGGGVNLNTAPSWVLGQILHGTEVSGLRPVDEDQVRRMLEEREDAWICETGSAGCIAFSELLGEDRIYPPLVTESTVFRVRSEARVGEIERKVETVIDRSVPSEPLRLTWRVR